MAATSEPTGTADAAAPDHGTHDRAAVEALAAKQAELVEVSRLYTHSCVEGNGVPPKYRKLQLRLLQDLVVKAESDVKRLEHGGAEPALVQAAARLGTQCVVVQRDVLKRHARQWVPFLIRCGRMFEDCLCWADAVCCYRDAPISVLNVQAYAELLSSLAGVFLKLDRMDEAAEMHALAAEVRLRL